MAQLNDLLSNISNIKNDIKQSIINKGQTVTNFASYPNAILNIQSGGSEGDILLFSNLNEMNSYTNANTGDLALVYDMNTNNLQALWQYTTNNAWELALTGLTANREYVNSARFWGANGVETGVLQVNNNLTIEQVKIKTQIYSDLSYLELNSNVTNISNVFANRTDLIEIPNINLMNITNMENTFYNCVNLNDRAYNIITNILPNASQLTNQYISNIGLDINKFTNEQINILNVKGYIDAVPKTIQNYYEIQWE